MLAKTLKPSMARHRLMTAPKLKVVTRDAPTIRAALYCRYSDEDQTPSIERQTADLEKVAPRLDLILNKRLYFSDAAQSATTLFDRPGLTRDLLDAAEKKLFDVVLVEHTDRLARKQADMFWLAEQFKRLGIKIFTPSGEVDPLRLTFESYQNEQFSIMLSRRVKSGQDNAIRDNRIPHGLGYGYDNQKDKPGEKVRNEDQAVIINRMFREYASWRSPRNIAVDLTRDKIPSPSGEGGWTFQTVNKILQNEIYIGVYVRNRVRRVRNYNTGKRDAHKAAPDDLVTADFPHLRIVDQGLWDAAQAVRHERANRTFGSKQIERATVTRKLHPFMGLFRCAECGSKMIIAGSGRNGDRSIVCSEAWWRSSCKHRKSYSLSRLTAHATEKMHSHLTDPDFVNERAKERAKTLASFEREASIERDTAQRDLDRVDLKIKKIIRLTEDDDSNDVPQEALDRMKELRAEQRGLKQRLTMLDAKITGATPHPNTVKALARDVDTLHKMLKDNPDDPACRMALGNLIERVAVHPTGSNLPYDVSLFARHAAYVGELPLFPEYEPKKSMENQSVRRINTGNAIVPSLSVSERPILLGRWREGISDRINAA
jgi:site-specific DNA recombinase